MGRSPGPRSSRPVTKKKKRRGGGASTIVPGSQPHSDVLWSQPQGLHPRGHVHPSRVSCLQNYQPCTPQVTRVLAAWRSDLPLELLAGEAACSSGRAFEPPVHRAGHLPLWGLFPAAHNDGWDLAGVLIGWLWLPRVDPQAGSGLGGSACGVRLAMSAVALAWGIRMSEVLAVYRSRAALPRQFQSAHL